MLLLLTKALHYHVTARLMLMLLSALFTALDSRPIRSSRDGYDAMSSSRLARTMRSVRAFVPEVEYVRSDLDDALL